MFEKVREILAIRRNKKDYSHLFTLTVDIVLPFYHESFMKSLGKQSGEHLTHKKIDEIYEQTKRLQTNLLCGKLEDSSYFIARGDSFIKEILEKGYVPCHSHPAFLHHFNGSKKEMEKKLMYYLAKDKRLTPVS
ncbi:MAG TPA: hypothetical protein VNM69_02300 [Bacillus sp. (in: firmicutes)]|nr:hypothetical protein [Bacillus sp. (in: firmicutes)]